MKLLYVDCFSGASGDMLLGALLDAGASEEAVRAALDGLGIAGWALETTTVTRGSVRARRARVTVDRQTRRAYGDIVGVIENATLEPRVAHLALAAFGLLGRAEAKMHDSPLETVHLHEVGATDALVDVVGSCAAVVDLAPDRIETSAIPTGVGAVASEAGVLPLPAPAVTEILSQRGATIYARGDLELITPTGAAILAAITDSFGPLPKVQLQAVGYGAGERDTDVPNVLRILIGELAGRPDGADVRLVETNIDDMAPELVPHVIDALIKGGAQDAWVTPVLMKKGRPAFMISALTAGPELDRVLDVLYAETTTLGVRMTSVDKDELEREWIEVQAAGHSLRVKVARRGGDVTTASPEYEDASRVARATGLPLKEVYRLTMLAAHDRLHRRSRSS